MGCKVTDNTIIRRLNIRKRHMQSLYPYTPRKAKFEHLKKTFVAREDIFKEIIDSIKAQAHSAAFQHWMVLGTRGMGKSHLITMIYHTIKTDDSLNGLWTPVLMNEEEQSIFSLHTLFLRILIQLSDEIKTADGKKATEIVSFVDAFRSGKESREEILESALAFLKDFMENSGKKLLLLLENTDEIFTRYLTTKKEVKKFRSILTHENFLLMIGTSPTFFDGISNVKAPLYDFFRLRQLHLLTYQEAVQLLNCWLEMDRQTEKKDKCPLPFKEDDYRLRVLFHLTGGNPRILLFLYMAVNGKDGIDNTLDTFTALLEEDLSNYYLSRIRNLSNQVQPIVIALAESNRNLTQTEIAQKTFLPVRSMGTAINRLEKDGMIKPVSEKKGKNTLYTLTDQLFRLWHQWRTSLDDRKVITALVEFLAVWYRQKDLVTYSMKRDITGLHCQEALDYRKTDQFKHLWQPFHVEAKARIGDLLVKEDYLGLFENFALLEETGYKTRTMFDDSVKKLEEEHKLDTAIERLQEQLSKKPDDMQRLKDLDKIYLHTKDLKAAENALLKGLKHAPLERWSYFTLFKFCLFNEEFNVIIKKLKSTIKLKEADNRFKSTGHFLLSLSYRFQKDQTPFLSNLKMGLSLLETLSDEERQEMLIAIIDFLVDILNKNTVQNLSEFIKTMNQIPSAITEVLRPLLHVVEYFEAFYSDSKNKKEPMAKAQRVLDSITDEIRGPVEQMIERVKSKKNK